MRINNTSAKNSLWILSERIFSLGVVAIITILSARHLGAENFGILNYGLTLVALFTGVMKLGLDSIMVNELINHKKREGEFLGTSILLRFFSSILSVIAISIVLLLLNDNQPILIIVSIIQSVILIFQAGYILDFWFQSKLKSKYVSLAKISATFLTSGYSIYLLLSGKGLIWFAASTVLTGVVVSLLLFIFYKKQGGEKLVFSTDAAKYLLSKSHHFIVANIISLIYVQIDKVMIGNMLGDSQLGIYSAALMLCTTWIFLPEAITTSLRPGIVHAKSKNSNLYLSKLQRLYFIIFWMSMIVAGVITLAAPILVPLLFGEQFIDAILITQISVWFAPLSALGMARNIWLVSEEKQKYAKYILISGVVMNIGLNLILIPSIGIVGAAYATIATELTTCFIAPLMFKATREHTRILLAGLLKIPR